jgi:hypothetical protein
MDRCNAFRSYGQWAITTDLKASSSDVVHSGDGSADVGDSESLFTARRSTSGGQQQLQRQQSGLAEYDDVSSSSGRRQSAIFDDVNFSGGRLQQQRPRQESAAAQDVSGYRGRKFSDCGDGGGQSWDDNVTSDRVGGDAGRESIRAFDEVVAISTIR